MSQLTDAIPKREVYYDPWTSGKSFFIRNDRNNFMPVAQGDLKRLLKQDGISSVVPKDETVSELDKVLNEIQVSKDVDYAGPLAGYKAGIHRVQNRRVLVTEPPIFIEPDPDTSRDWATLRTLLTNLLGEVQLPYFYGWLKVAITALRQGKRRPGQALVMAGPAGCGKSLVQNLITKLLGGRSAKPYQYMTGATQFNGELFQAEHQMIEDEAASFDFRDRTKLGRNLVGMVVNESQKCHPKNRQGLTLHPFWRLSITLNDEPEALMVLPNLDESIQDKLILLRAFKAEMPMPTSTLEERWAFMDVLDADLRRFVHYLLETFEVPEAMRCSRYGVAHFHHPELLQMMSTLSPEAKLLSLIDTEIFKKNGPLWNTALERCDEEWEGKASEVEALLTGKDSGVAYEARQLLRYNSACGQYLSRLHRTHGERVKKGTIRDGYQIWSIVPPSGK